MKENNSSAILNNPLKTILSKITEKYPDIKLKENTTEELEEWVKCKSDFFYFVKKYVKLDVPGKDNEFNYHIGQEILIRSILQYNYVVCLKTRQIGITTIVRAFCVWLTIFQKNYTIGVISKLSADATAFIRKCINIIDNLPDFLKPKFVKKTEQQYILANGSLAMAAAVSSSQPENTLRSNPITFLIIDEGAFIHKIENALSGLLPTTITAQKAAKANGIIYGILIISTPNKTKGVGKWFYKQYKEALINNGLSKNQNTGSYRAVKLHWKDIGYPFDEDWYESQCKVLNYDQKIIAQEIDCVFLPSSKNGLVKEDKIIELANNQRPPAYKIPEIGGDIYVFDKDLPEKRNKHRYLIGIDTATFLGRKSFSSIIAIDYDTNDQVIEYVGKLNIFDYPNVIRRVCRELGENIFIVIERNTIGESVVENLYRDSEYSHKLFFTIQRNKKGETVRKVPGIETTVNTKPLFLEAASIFVNENINKIYGERTIMQLLETEIENGKLLNYPNDLVMVLSFLAYIKLNNLAKFNNTITKEEIYFESTLENLNENQIINYLYENNNGLLIYNNKKDIIKEKNDILSYLYDTKKE